MFQEWEAQASRVGVPGQLARGDRALEGLTRDRPGKMGTWDIV